MKLTLKPKLKLKLAATAVARFQKAYLIICLLHNNWTITAGRESKLKCQIACATRNENQIRPQMSWPGQKAKAKAKVESNSLKVACWQQLTEEAAWSGERSA